MATAQTAVQVCGRILPCLFSSTTHVSKSKSGPLCSSSIRYKRRRDATCFQVINYSNKSCDENASQFPGISLVNVTFNGLGHIKCNCQRAENVSGLTSEDGNGALYMDNAEEYSTINGNKPNVPEFETIRDSRSGNFSSCDDILNNGSILDTLQDIADSVEDEAWEILKESIVYY